MYAVKVEVCSGAAGVFGCSVRDQKQVVPILLKWCVEGLTK